MARLPRIEIAGYYHIVNRGVERRKVFYHDEDFQYFLKSSLSPFISYSIYRK